MLQLAAAGRLPSHHIYQPGKLADSCAPGDFDASYWTADGAPGAQPGTALVGTTHAQRVIYQHQHPADCAGLRFLVYRPCPHGIGSNIHVMGQALSLAMRFNRVLMVAEDREHPYYDRDYCPPGTSVHDCYFEPVSNCSWADVAAAQGLDTFNHAMVQQVRLPEEEDSQTPVIGSRCNPGAAPWPSAGVSEHYTCQCRQGQGGERLLMQSGQAMGERSRRRSTACWRRR